MAKAKKKAQAKIIPKPVGSGNKANSFAPIMSYQQDPDTGGNYQVFPVQTLNPQPATIGGYTYNNPVAVNQPAAIAPVTLSNPGAPLPDDHPIYETVQRQADPGMPIQDPGVINATLSTGTLTDASGTPAVSTTSATTDNKKVWLWVLLAIVVAGGLYYYFKQKK